MKKFFSTISLAIISIIVFGQQWNGNANTEELIWRNGNVGIGTNTASRKLTVFSETNGAIAEFKSKENSGNQGLFISVSTESPYVTTLSSSGMNVGSIAFNTGITERMRINANGNVGIGTTEPAATLDVEGEIRAGAVNGVGTDYYAYMKANYSANNCFELGVGTHKLITTKDDYFFGGTLQFWTADTERVTINSVGNVGIGTTSPKENLHLEGNLLIDAFGKGNESGIFFRENFSSSNKYNLSILAFDHNGASPDGLSINGQDGVSFCTGSNTRNERMRIDIDGNVGIGTSETGTHKLAVDGTIGAREIVVEAGTWSDFVFNTDYKLKDLEEVEIFIEENKHLPDIPSEKEVVENGIQVGEMNAKLLQKIEELTLYMIDINKRVKLLEEENKALKKENSILKTQ